MNTPPPPPGIPPDGYPGGSYGTPPGFASYPRQSMGTGRPPGAYFDYISRAWELIRADMGTWVACSLVYIVATYAMSIPLSFVANIVAYGSIFPTPGTPPSPLALGLSLLVGVVPYFFFYPMQVGMALMGRRASYGERVTFGEMFAPYRRFGSVGVTSLITYFAILLGLLILFIPGLIAMALFSLAPLFAAEGEGPGEALSHSVQASGRFFLSMVALVFAAGLLSVLGACLCGIGLLFTMPILPIVLGLTYDTIRPLNTAPVPIPSYGYGTPPGAPPVG